MKKTNTTVSMQAAARRDAMREAMFDAKCVDIPAFVKAMGLLRQEDEDLMKGFTKAYSIYEYKYAAFDVATNEAAASALDRVFNKLLGVNCWYKSYTESLSNDNEGDSILMKRVRTLKDKEDAVEDIRRYMAEYMIRLSFYEGNDHYEA